MKGATMKSASFLALLAMSACLALPASAASTPFDLNGDKVSDAADVQFFLKALSQGAPLDRSLDLDGDGSVGLSDALLYGRWIDGLWEKPAAGWSRSYFRNPADEAVFSHYQADLKSRSGLTGASLQLAYPDATVPMRGYDSGTVEYEAEAGAAMAKWSPADWDRAGFFSQVRKQGVAVSPSMRFPNYFQALDQIHSADLPLLFTTDAVLHTLYLSYDNILMELEETLFEPWLEKILVEAEAYAGRNYAEDEYGSDVREMLGTALYLLNPARGDILKTDAIATHLSDISALLFTKANLFGRDTSIDFSQFKPRGHYTRTPALGRYFQAMMWLSRADLAFDLRAQPVDATGAPAKPEFTRMKKGALTLWDCLVNSGSYPAWLEMDHYLEYMVGMSDGLNAKGMGAVAQALGVTRVPEFLKAFPESRFDSVVAAGHFGAQAILSQGKDYPPGGADNLGLSPIFSFLPQRFILDAFTFSQAVFPLTEASMPSALQVAFVLGDNASLKSMTDLGGTAGGSKLPAVLGAQRTLYDGISAEGWSANLYTGWLDFLRKLNGAEGNAKVSPVFRSPAWRAKMRNTQLASWAQLRHNTILYAKQSYTGGLGCSFPKAYVEPYPEFFAAVSAYARTGEALFKDKRPQVAAYFAGLGTISGQLQSAAARSAQGLGPTDDQAAWLKTAITSKSMPAGCTSVKVYDGWYLDLIYKVNRNALENSTDFTIADVHTKPETDDLGPMQVLHEATGDVNLAAVAVEIDSCVTVFVGPVASFYEVDKPGTLDRITDEEWTKTVQMPSPAPVRPPWASKFLGP